MYKKISFSPVTEDTTAMLIALLQENAEGFEEGENRLHVFYKENNFNEENIASVAKQYSIAYTVDAMPEQNWNKSWEANFEPVRVDNFAGIRALFHEPLMDVKYELLIQPKMSFGTGHHATTWLMMKAMEAIDFTNKHVFDFGTGTGILSILSKKMGAGTVLAIDNDEWSVNNAKENMALNGLENKIDIQRSANPQRYDLFDIILANINKNVLLEHIPVLTAQLRSDGVLLLSGLLETDETEIIEKCRDHHVELIYKRLKDKWLLLKFQKKEKA